MPLEKIGSRRIHLPQLQKGKERFSCSNIDCGLGKFTVMTCEGIKPNYTSLDSQRVRLYRKYTFDRIHYRTSFFESSVD